MPMTNAERQRLYRERKARQAPQPLGPPASRNGVTPVTSNGTATVTTAMPVTCSPSSVTPGTGDIVLQSGSCARPRPGPARGSVHDCLPVAPAPVEVFMRCCARMSRGDTWKAIAGDEGTDRKALWAACIVRSRQEDYKEMWAEAQRLEVEIRRHELSEAGMTMLRAATGEIPMREESANTPSGPTSRTVTEKSPQALTAGAGILFPREHGRLARGAEDPPPPSNTVNIGQIIAMLDARGAAVMAALSADIPVKPLGEAP